MTHSVVENLLAIKWDRLRICAACALNLLYFSDLDTACALVHGPLNAETIAAKMEIFCDIPNIPRM